jgi:NAD(P)-dependent dehydrogenase (short-subunit alcohol dehydrogenase family)
MPKTWLITGSASGIGRSTADLVLARGDNLVATARDVNRLLDLARRYGKQVALIELDVTDMSASRGAVATAMERFGRLDVLLNNAGYAHLSPFEQVSEDDFKAEIDTNFYGVVNLTRAALPVMRQQKSGHIINISSSSARFGSPGSTRLWRCQMGGERFHRFACQGGQAVRRQGHRRRARQHPHELDTGRPRSCPAAASGIRTDHRRDHEDDGGLCR